MVLVIIMAAAVIAAAIIGTIYLDKRENQKWQKELHRIDLFQKIKHYGN